MSDKQHPCTMAAETGDAHDLVPAALETQIPALYATERTADPTVWIKLFTPDSSWTWYITEYDRADQLAFGLVVGFETELGYFSLAELRSIRGPLCLRIERDLYFEPRALSEVRAQL